MMQTDSFLFDVLMYIYCKLFSDLCSCSCSRPCAEKSLCHTFSPQTIHVAIVCAGYNASRDVVTLVKSVLFHRYMLLFP